MKTKKTLRLIAVIVLATLLLGAIAYAQDDSVTEGLPANFDDLKGPAGLGAVVVIIVGLLKKAGKFGLWIQAAPLNAFAVSLGVSGVILVIVYLVEYFGVYDIAQGFWLNFGVMWVVSQGVYNAQKVATKTVKTALDV